MILSVCSKGVSMPKKHCQSAKTRKRKGKDLDEVAVDLKPKNADKLLNQAVDPDLPGDAQFYCIECSRHFTSQDVLEGHKKTKSHKQRVKTLKQTPYSQKEADAAGGLGIFDRQLVNGPRPLKRKKIDRDSGIVAP